MTTIQIFKNEEFGNIRTMVTQQGDTLFCAKDVAMALGYSNTKDAILRHVCKEDKLGSQITTSGQSRMMTFINESGLYSLILSSKLESARRFKHWVTSEVLPAIRKQGGYMVVRADDSNEEIYKRSLQIAHEAIDRRDAEIAQLRPKADYVNEVLESVSCFTTSQIAKGMCMTAQELNRLLCQHCIQFGKSGQYMLYADYARKGLARNRIFKYYDTYGDLHTISQLVWTERGREFIYHLVRGCA